MHTALCHLLPPPSNGPSMLAAIRQRSGVAVAAGAALLPHPLFALASSRTEKTARGATLRQAASAAEPSDHKEFQFTGARGNVRQFSSRSSRIAILDQQDLLQAGSSGSGQHSEAGGSSHSSRSSRGRGSFSGRGSSSAGRVAADGARREHGGANLGSRAGAGRRGTGRARGGERVFGGLPAGNQIREFVDSTMQRPSSFSGADEDFSERGQHRGRVSARGRSGGRGGSQSRQRGPADSRPSRPASTATATATAQQFAAAATPSIGAAAAAQIPHAGPYPDSDPVPRNAGITGGRWDANDAALVAQSLKDAETLRRKFADQGRCPGLQQPFTRFSLWSRSWSTLPR
jgi:hypothetical protein